MAVRAQVFPEQPGMIAEALAGAMDMAQHAVPALGDAVALGDVPKDLVSTLLTTVECCQQAAIQRSGTDAGLTLPNVFAAVSSILGAVCRPFADGADLSSDDVQQLAQSYPPSVFRLVAFAVHTAALIGGEQSSGQLKWLACLKQLLNCRFYIPRVHANELRDVVVLTTRGLWKLARPQLSRWSADLDDYFTLDELETLAGAYSGSCSLADQLLLQVLQEYESTTRQSVQRVLVAFGPVAAETYVRERVGRVRYFIERDENDVGVMSQDAIANALAAIDSGRLLRTITEFPVRSGNKDCEDDAAAQLLNVLSGNKCRADLGAPDHGLIYNVQFILPWLWTVVSSGQGADVRRLIDSNALGVAIAALSSDSERVRKLAYFTLDVAYKLVAESHSLFGRSQCVLLLNVLRNGVSERSESNFPQIAFTVTMFIATSLHVVLRPEHYMYGAVNRLLLRRPWIKPTEVPLLRTVMRSSIETPAARTYVLRMASQMTRAFGQCADAFRRVDLVNTMLAQLSALGDVQAAKAALVMLFNISSTQNAEALSLHVSKNRFALLGWIRGQVSLEANSLVSAAAQATDEQNTAAARGVGAAVGNLTALVRVVIRVVANFPLARVGSGELVYNRFWVVQTPEQLNAAGQSATVCVLQRVLDSVVLALAKIDDASEPMMVAVLALVRTCVAAARLLAEMQASTAEECCQSLMLQSSALVPAVLSVLRCIEPAARAASKVTATHYDLCAAAAVARSLSADSLFYQPECGLYSLYTACVDELFAWTTSVSGPVCTAANMADIQSPGYAR
ncbi:hypothetical protein GGF43_001550 [Coemansia sp. RSA 2618]|nr:hypothetical protein GGF43_001550 [Coemansia sp. RSA 2618]